MAANDIFRSAMVKKPQRARFDFSHSNSYGMRFGVGIPSLTTFIVPGDEISMSMSQIARLAPMPVPTFANMKVRHDFFFVPCRLMYNEADMGRIFGSAGSDARERASLDVSSFFDKFFHPTGGTVDDLSKVGDIPLAGSLFDYLGYPVVDDVNSVDVPSLRSRVASLIQTGTRILQDGVPTYADLQNFYGDIELIRDDMDTALSTGAKLLIEPLIAYHYIFRDWYRFTGVESGENPDDPAFKWLENHILSSGFDSAGNAAELISDFLSTEFVHGNMRFADLGRLFQVHLTKDMFSSARYGNKPAVLIPTGENANIPTLREASAIQRFIDLVSIVGSRYFDKIKALFNVTADGFADDRVQFLARYQQYIKVGEVLTTATTDNARTGDYAGRGILIDGKYLFKRRFTEPGWLMCISSVIPDIAYSGLPRQLTDTFYVDTPIPSLSQIGDQSVLNREVSFNWYDTNNRNDLSFGDQFRYYAYKSAVNEVHGSFRMASQRSWVPTQDYMNVFNVLGASRVDPVFWNKFFNDTADEPVFGDRFFFKVDFSMFITRQLPKYINYHL